MGITHGRPMSLSFKARLGEISLGDSTTVPLGCILIHEHFRLSRMPMVKSCPADGGRRSDGVGIVVIYCRCWDNSDDIPAAYLLDQSLELVIRS